MFDHVTIRVADRAASTAFYDTVLRELGPGMTRQGPVYTRFGELSLTQADAARPPARHLHIGFRAPSREHVDAFHAAGLKAGHRDDGAPGERDYTPGYYGAFLLDPDGNSAEAVHYEGMRDNGVIDHLWLRVADVDAATAFHEAIAPYAGLRVARLSAGHMIARGPDGASFSMVHGDPFTENVHIAFPAPDRATVDAFHAAALRAGYADNGPPGLRPEYDAGYYGAFALGPAGHNIEVVNNGATP